jgi:hypothetical protein
MATVTQGLDVPLPEGVEATTRELEHLRAMLEALVAMHFEHGESWPEILHKLEGEGWTVRARFGWSVEARRGRECERALGRDRDEAFTELYRLTCLDSEEGTP